MSLTFSQISLSVKTENFDVPMENATLALLHVTVTKTAMTTVTNWIAVSLFKRVAQRVLDISHNTFKLKFDHNIQHKKILQLRRINYFTNE